MAHILIVESPYYTQISEMLLKGAAKALSEKGHSIAQVSVPGALEIPAAIAFAMDRNHYDGYVALGCVIRGDTSHYDIVSNESAHGLNLLAVQKCAAIGNGILTVENEAQALERADPDKKNKGGEAAIACMRMIDVKRELGSR